MPEDFRVRSVLYLLVLLLTYIFSCFIGLVITKTFWKDINTAPVKCVLEYPNIFVPCFLLGFLFIVVGIIICGSLLGLFLGYLYLQKKCLPKQDEERLRMLQSVQS